MDFGDRGRGERCRGDLGVIDACLLGDLGDLNCSGDQKDIGPLWAMVLNP